jgi:hypothetical protein
MNREYEREMSATEIVLRVSLLWSSSAVLLWFAVTHL